MTKPERPAMVVPLTPERAARFERVFGHPFVVVTSDQPEPALVRGEVCLVYWIDLDALTPEQTEAMLDDLCARFPDIPREGAHEELKQGVPVIASEVVVMS